MAADESVTLHSSWRGLATAMFGPLALLIVGVGAAVTRRPHAINLVVGMIGLVLLVIVLVDFPVACRFDARGVQRRCPLRRAMLDWDRIDRFTRAAPAVRFGRETSPSGSPSKKTPVRLRPTGLVASIGRRRYLLVNRCESVAEHQRLRALVAKVSEALADTLDTPPEGTAPTWVDRRKRWGSTTTPG